MTELNTRRCPFCGGEDTSCGEYFVSCIDCHALGPNTPFPDRDLVIQRWNRRPIEECSLEREAANGALLEQRDAEILRLKKRITELEEENHELKEIVDDTEREYVMDMEMRL